ncbi:purine-nucleoside phosphorylase [Bernardetia sp.]|uniref:purine-nucleoside phosphorylase n=1 Tax=Bernardetia sp. TaxID=1937974 RepID=UPI0025C3D84A|nr:purine-nucleoside phosphorylase [Bernardetia sp.]
MEFEKLNEALTFIRSFYKEKPKVGIILGTGLGALVNEVETELTISYQDIPHFPLSTVESHAGKLIFGKLSGHNVIVMQGRFHYYEGYSMKQIVFPVRVMKMLGIEYLFVSNAAGALHPNFKLSDLMILEDHINLLPSNPLIGKNIPALGIRFPDMFEPYSNKLIELAENVISENQELSFSNFHKGVYVSVSGPNLETRAEYRYLRTIGADAVGMSTVPEVIAAVHMNLPVFAVSVLTDLCQPENVKPITLEEVLEAAAVAEPKMAFLFKEMIKKLD